MVETYVGLGGRVEGSAPGFHASEVVSGGDLGLVRWGSRNHW